MVTALKTGELDAINEIPPTSARTLKSSKAWDQGHFWALLDARLHLQPRSEQARPSRAAQPEGARGIRVRDRPQRDRADRVGGLGYATPGPSTLIPEGNDDRRHAVARRSRSRPLPFNIDKANQILDDLGYTMGSDGIRVANGVPRCLMT